MSFVFVINGCGLKLRNPSDIPPQLHTLYLNTPNPYNPFIVEFKRTLKSLKVNMVDSPHQTAIELKIPEVDYIQHNPDLLTTVVAVRYFISLKFTAILYNTKNNKVILKHPFNISRSVLLNANQALVPNILLLASKELTHEGVNLLYYWLISENVKNALEGKKRIKDANSIKQTHDTLKKQTCTNLSY